MRLSRLSINPLKFAKPPAVTRILFALNRFALSVQLDRSIGEDIFPHHSFTMICTHGCDPLSVFGSRDLLLSLNQLAWVDSNLHFSFRK